MIPALASIVSAYVAFRMVEVFFLAESRYAGKMQHIIVAVLALLVLRLTAFSIPDIYAAAARTWCRHLSQPSPARQRALVLRAPRFSLDPGLPQL